MIVSLLKIFSKLSLMDGECLGNIIVIEWSFIELSCYLV